jgi:hypothetical protein
MLPSVAPASLRMFSSMFNCLTDMAGATYVRLSVTCVFIIAEVVLTNYLGSSYKLTVFQRILQTAREPQRAAPGKPFTSERAGRRRSPRLRYSTLGWSMPAGRGSFLSHTCHCKVSSYQMSQSHPSSPSTE